MGDASERIWESGVAEAGLHARSDTRRRPSRRPRPRSRAAVVEEGQDAEVAAAVRSALGTGPTTPRRIEGNRQALMPYVALLAILPLGFVLYRRNL